MYHVVVQLVMGREKTRILKKSLIKTLLPLWHLQKSIASQRCVDRSSFVQRSGKLLDGTLMKNFLQEVSAEIDFSQRLISISMANSTYQHAVATKKVTHSSFVKVSPIEGLLIGDFLDVFLHSVCKMKILIVVENQYEKQASVSAAYRRLMQTKQYQINWQNVHKQDFLGWQNDGDFDKSRYGEDWV